MKKIIIGLILGIAIVVPKKALAQSYVVENFKSEINLNQDQSLSIKETINIEFLEQKHGIFRIIPYIYSAKGKTIKSEVRVEGVRDENGKPIPFTVENFNKSKKIQIGNTNKTVIGDQIYVISYKVDKVVLDYGDGPEIYWNVTGNEWEAIIPKAEAKVTSSFGKITKVECYDCVSNFNEGQADFTGKQGLTIVVQIDKSNQLIKPSIAKVGAERAKDNWGYIVAIMPLAIMLTAWWYKGRDKKYLTENVFYKPADTNTKTVPLLNRPHLPLVYGPIDNLSPAEVGTITDEEVDTKDIVAEIVELARLGYYTIEKIETKKLFNTERDYKLTRTDKEPDQLSEYQRYLLEKLFAEKLEIKISDLKDHFYIHLNELRKKIYQELDDKEITSGNISNIKAIWSGWATVLNMAAGVIIFTVFMSMTGNPGPLVPFFIGGGLTYLIARLMPRKTAWGYSLHRQTEGLKYYLGKGKWREEIAEKQLFLEEMLPLAISLGIVNKLAADMNELGIEPPKYFQGIAINSFASDISHFNKVAAAGVVSAPINYSGSGSWSGGSGFSGGGGGGFGGGGGGSW